MKSKNIIVISDDVFTNQAIKYLINIVDWSANLTFASLKTVISESDYSRYDLIIVVFNTPECLAYLSFHSTELISKNDLNKFFIIHDDRLNETFLHPFLHTLNINSPVVKLREKLNKLISSVSFYDNCTKAVTLTNRQKQVLTLINRKINNKRIGQILGINEKTVSNHRIAIRRAFKISKQQEKILFCNEINLKQLMSTQ